MNEIDSIYADWYVDSKIKGLRFRVDVSTDEFGDPGKEEWTSKEHVERFYQDLWEFVIVTVTPVYRDEEIGACTASLSGVVSGFLEPGADRIGKEALAEYPVPELVSQAEYELMGTGLGVEITECLQRARDIRERAADLQALQDLLKAAK